MAVVQSHDYHIVRSVRFEELGRWEADGHTEITAEAVNPVRTVRLAVMNLQVS